MRLTAHTDIHLQAYTRSSADAEGQRDAPQIRNIALEKACNKGMTFKDTQGRYSIHLAVLIQYRRVTDTQTNTLTDTRRQHIPR